MTGAEGDLEIWSAPAGKRESFPLLTLQGPKTRQQNTSKPKRASLESGAHIRPPAKGGVRLGDV